jgi:WD40 repeat protein
MSRKVYFVSNPPRYYAFVRILNIHPGGFSILNTYCFKTQITLITIFLLSGCSPAATPESNDTISNLNTIALGTDVISSSTAEDVVLLNTFSGHTKMVLDVAFSAQGKYLAASSQDLNIKLWDVRSGQEVHSFRMTSVDMADIDISNDGNLLASGEAIWDLNSLQEIHILERGSRFPASVAFSPDGSTLALGLFDQQITIWDVTSGQPAFSFDAQQENRTKRMVFSPDGTLLAVGVIDGTVRLLDIESGEIANILSYAGETDIHDLAFSPDGNYLATGGRVPAVILWNPAIGEVVRTFRVQDHVISVTFSPDSTVLAASGGDEKVIRLWDVESGKLIKSLPHNDRLLSIAFSPDGRLLAAGSFDNQVYLWGIPPNQ